MKKCSDCNIEMLEKYNVIPGERITKYIEPNLLYVVVAENNYYNAEKISDNYVKCRICPKCGKIELYANPDDLKNNLE